MAKIHVSNVELSLPQTMTLGGIVYKRTSKRM